MGLRKTAADSLGVEPSSEAMAGWEPTAEGRVAQLGEEAKSLRETIGSIFSCLWTGEAVPASISELAVRLGETPDAFERLRECAARGGTEMALAFMISWFSKGLDAGALDKVSSGFRVGTNYDTLRKVGGVRLAACRIGEYVDFDQFIPEEPEPEDSATEEEAGEEAAASHQPTD